MAPTSPHDVPQGGITTEDSKFQIILS